MELQALGDAPRFGWLEGIVQRAQLVSVEVVQHQPYRLCVRVCIINQPPHLMSEVHSSAPLGHLDMPPASFRLTEHEQVEGEVAVITREQAAEADYNLSPSRWVGQTDVVDQRPISEIIADMQRLDSEAREIDASLTKMLVGLQ